MIQILNSQSDAIVVVNTEKKQKDPDLESVEADVNKLDLLFCNNKSVKLFDFDLTRVIGSQEDQLLALNLLHLPQFVPIDKEEALRLDTFRPDHDWLNKLRELQNSARS